MSEQNDERRADPVSLRKRVGSIAASIAEIKRKRAEQDKLWHQLMEGQIVRLRLGVEEEELNGMYYVRNNDGGLCGMRAKGAAPVAFTIDPPVYPAEVEYATTTGELLDPEEVRKALRRSHSMYRNENERLAAYLRRKALGLKKKEEGDR